jgi:hypothetical protein
MESFPIAFRFPLALRSYETKSPSNKLITLDCGATKQEVEKTPKIVCHGKFLSTKKRSEVMRWFFERSQLQR